LARGGENLGKRRYLAASGGNRHGLAAAEKRDLRAKRGVPVLVGGRQCNVLSRTSDRDRARIDHAAGYGLPQFQDLARPDCRYGRPSLLCREEAREDLADL